MKKNIDFNLLSLLTIFALFGGSAFYHSIEKWSWLNSIYFSVMTLTTVGYGDFVPITDVGKIFTMFYVLIGIGIIFGFIRAVAKRGIANAERRGMAIGRKKQKIKKTLKAKPSN